MNITFSLKTTSQDCIKPPREFSENVYQKKLNALHQNSSKKNLKKWQGLCGKWENKMKYPFLIAKNISRRSKREWKTERETVRKLLYL